MTTVKLSGTLPKGDADGLSGYSERFRSEENIFAVVALVQTTKLAMDLPSHVTVPTLTIRAIELLSDPVDVSTVRRLLRAQYVERTGNEELPDLEDAIRAILSGTPKEEKE